MDRKEKAPTKAGRTGTPRPDPEKEHRLRFAQEIARAEFGRFYFGEKQARDLREAGRVKPKRKE